VLSKFVKQGCEYSHQFSLSRATLAVALLRLLSKKVVPTLHSVWW
jgi:hypothetical protein